MEKTNQSRQFLTGQFIAPDVTKAFDAFTGRILAGDQAIGTLDGVVHLAQAGAIAAKHFADIFNGFLAQFRCQNAARIERAVDSHSSADEPDEDQGDDKHQVTYQTEHANRKPYPCLDHVDKS